MNISQELPQIVFKLSQAICNFKIETKASSRETSHNQYSLKEKLNCYDKISLKLKISQLNHDLEIKIKCSIKTKPEIMFKIHTTQQGSKECRLILYQNSPQILNNFKAQEKDLTLIQNKNKLK